MSNSYDSESDGYVTAEEDNSPEATPRQAARSVLNNSDFQDLRTPEHGDSRDNQVIKDEVRARSRKKRKQRRRALLTARECSGATPVQTAIQETRSVCTQQQCKTGLRAEQVSLKQQKRDEIQNEQQKRAKNDCKTKKEQNIPNESSESSGQEAEVPLKHQACTYKKMPSIPQKSEQNGRDARSVTMRNEREHSKHSEQEQEKHASLNQQLNKRTTTPQIKELNGTKATNGIRKNHGSSDTYVQEKEVCLNRPATEKKAATPQTKERNGGKCTPASSNSSEHELSLNRPATEKKAAMPQTKGRNGRKFTPASSDSSEHELSLIRPATEKKAAMLQTKGRNGRKGMPTSSNSSEHELSLNRPATENKVATPQTKERNCKKCTPASSDSSEHDLSLNRPGYRVKVPAIKQSSHTKKEHGKFKFDSPDGSRKEADAARKVKASGLHYEEPDSKQATGIKASGNPKGPEKELERDENTEKITVSEGIETEDYFVQKEMLRLEYLQKQKLHQMEQEKKQQEQERLNRQKQQEQLKQKQLKRQQQKRKNKQIQKHEEQQRREQSEKKGQENQKCEQQAHEEEELREKEQESLTKEDQQQPGRQIQQKQKVGEQTQLRSRQDGQLQTSEEQLQQKTRLGIKMQHQNTPLQQQQKQSILQPQRQLSKERRLSHGQSLELRQENEQQSPSAVTRNEYQRHMVAVGSPPMLPTKKHVRCENEDDITSIIRIRDPPPVSLSEFDEQIHTTGEDSNKLDDISAARSFRAPRRFLQTLRNKVGNFLNPGKKVRHKRDGEGLYADDTEVEVGAGALGSFKAGATAMSLIEKHDVAQGRDGLGLLAACGEGKSIQTSDRCCQAKMESEKQQLLPCIPELPTDNMDETTRKALCEAKESATERITDHGNATSQGNSTEGLSLAGSNGRIRGKEKVPGLQATQKETIPTQTHRSIQKASPSLLQKEGSTCGVGQETSGPVRSGKAPEVENTPKSETDVNQGQACVAAQNQRAHTQTTDILPNSGEAVPGNNKTANVFTPDRNKTQSSSMVQTAVTTPKAAVVAHTEKGKQKVQSPRSPIATRVNNYQRTTKVTPTKAETLLKTTEATATNYKRTLPQVTAACRRTEEASPGVAESAPITPVSNDSSANTTQQKGSPQSKRPSIGYKAAVARFMDRRAPRIPSPEKAFQGFSSDVVQTDVVQVGRNQVDLNGGHKGPLAAGPVALPSIKPKGRDCPRKGGTTVGNQRQRVGTASPKKATAKIYKAPFVVEIERGRESALQTALHLVSSGQARQSPDAASATTMRHVDVGGRVQRAMACTGADSNGTSGQLSSSGSEIEIVVTKPITLAQSEDSKIEIVVTKPIDPKDVTKSLEGTSELLRGATDAREKVTDVESNEKKLQSFELQSESKYNNMQESSSIKDADREGVEVTKNVKNDVKEASKHVQESANKSTPAESPGAALSERKNVKSKTKQDLDGSSKTMTRRRLRYGDISPDETEIKDLEEEEKDTLGDLVEGPLLYRGKDEGGVGADQSGNLQMTENGDVQHNPGKPSPSPQKKKKNKNKYGGNINYRKSINCCCEFTCDYCVPSWEWDKVIVYQRKKR